MPSGMYNPGMACKVHLTPYLLRCDDDIAVQMYHTEYWPWQLWFCSMLTWTYSSTLWHVWWKYQATIWRVWCGCWCHGVFESSIMILHILTCSVAIYCPFSTSQYSQYSQIPVTGSTTPNHQRDFQRPPRHLGSWVDGVLAQWKTAGYRDG